MTVYEAGHYESSRGIRSRTRAEEMCIRDSAQPLRRRGTERSQEIGRVNMTRCPYACARGARRFQRALTQTDRLEPAVRLLVDVALSF